MAEDLRAQLTREVMQSFGLMNESAETIIEAASTITNSYSKWKFSARRADLQIKFFAWIKTLIVIASSFLFVSLLGHCWTSWSLLGFSGISSFTLDASNILAVFVLTAAYQACNVFQGMSLTDLNAAKEEFSLVSLKLLTQTLRTLRERDVLKLTSMSPTSGHDAFNLFERIVKTATGLLGILYLAQASNLKDLIYGLGTMLNLRSLFPSMTIFQGFGYDEGMTVQGFLALKWVQFMELSFHIGTSIVCYIPYKIFRFMKRMFTARRIDTDNPDDDGVQLDEHWFRKWQDETYAKVKSAVVDFKFYGPTLTVAVALASALFYYQKKKKNSRGSRKMKPRFSPLAIVPKKEAEEVKERPSDEPRSWEETQISRSMTLNYTDDVPNFEMLAQYKGDTMHTSRGLTPAVAIPGSPVYKNIIRVMHSMLQIGSMYAGSSFITGNYLVTAGHCLTRKNGKLGLWVRDPNDPETWLWCPLAREFKSTLAGGYVDSIAACHIHHKLANMKRVTVILPEEHGPISVPVWIQGQQSTWGISSGNYRRCYEFNPSFLVLTATIHAGTSGAPVFDTNGAIIGIVSCECQATQENFACGFTPEIIAFLREEHSGSVGESPPMVTEYGSRQTFTSITTDEESSTETDAPESDTNGQKQTKKKSSKKSGNMNGNQNAHNNTRKKRGKGQGDQQKKEKEPPQQGHGSEEYPSKKDLKNQKKEMSLEVITADVHAPDVV